MGVFPSPVAVEEFATGAQTVAHAVHGEAVPGAGDVDAVGAVGLDRLGLAGQFGGFGQWNIIRKPATSMPSPRAAAMCWAEMSASVQ